MERDEKSPLQELIGSSFRDIAELGDDRAGAEALLSWLNGEEVQLPPTGRTKKTLSVSSPEALLYGRR